MNVDETIESIHQTVQEIKRTIAGIAVETKNLSARMDQLESPRSIRTGDKMLKESDSVVRFLADRCLMTPARQTETSRLYEGWCEWCKKNGIDPGHQTKFGRLLRIAVPGIGMSISMKDNVQRRYYKGIGLQVDWSKVEDNA